MATTSRSRVDYLTQSLQLVSNELQATIDLEMQKLKDDEKALKDALKLKTRQELITTMERELEMGQLNNFLPTSKSMETQIYQPESTSSLNKSHLSESIKFSNSDPLALSNLLLTKLTDECNICSSDMNSLSLSDHQMRANEFLNQSATQPAFKNQFYPDTSGFVNPNVVSNYFFLLKF